MTRAAGTLFLAAMAASAVPWALSAALPPAVAASVQRPAMTGTAVTAAPASPTAQAATAAPVAPAAPPSPAPAAISPAAQAPSFPVTLPSAPLSLSAEFAFVTKAAEAARPVLKLSWEASESGTYVVKGYKLMRRLQGEPAYQLRMGGVGASAGLTGVQLLTDTVAEDSVLVGQVLDYAVVAVDAKGNSSAFSAPAIVDLGRLDPTLLAPRAPKGLTATSARISVKLKWEAAEAWFAALSGYRVYRSDKAAPLTLTAAFAYEDISPASKVDFVYRVVSVDTFSRESTTGLTVTARATGTLAPAAPLNLTATVKPEKVSLAWEKSEAGTSPVTAYLLTRIIEAVPGESGESVKKLAPMNLSRTSYSETVEGDRNYRYELRAADLEGNSSVASSLRLWVPSKPFNRTSLLLMPTAYSNLPDRDTGANVNVLFDLYIGELYETYHNPITDVTKSGLFQPLQSSGQLGVVSLDLKESFLAETWLSPALALGFYGAALVPFGGQSSQQVAVSSTGGGFKTLGNVYAVASKRLFSKRSAVHIGGMLGNLSDSLVSIAPQDWALTLRHLTPGGNYTELFTRFLDPKLGYRNSVGGPDLPVAPNMLFGGIQFPMTVPLLFTRWKTGLKVELMSPILPDATDLERSELPLIWNFHLDNLPLFGFEFSLFQFKGGTEWLAFYHIPDLTWSF